MFRVPNPVTDQDARRALREHMHARRSAQPASVRLAAADALATQVRGIEAWYRVGRVAGYWAVRGEMPLHALLAPRPTFDYCLPCLSDDRRLRFAPWRAGEPLVQNRYGIPEPDIAPDEQLAADAIDIVLVPLLAFDRHGTRLGSGGGYYDRSFAFLSERTRPSRPLLIGIAYGFQEVERLHAEPWDIALDYVATDAELIECCS